MDQHTALYLTTLPRSCVTHKTSVIGKQLNNKLDPQLATNHV